jgi:hypothetical protein
MQVKISDKKTIIINDREIKNLMEQLKLTQEQAIDTWLFDHDYTTNEQVEILSKKAKENKTDKIVVSDKTTRKQTERKPKINDNKIKIINYLFEGLREMDNLTNLEIVNSQKILEFNFNGKNYKLDLIEKREKK